MYKRQVRLVSDGKEVKMSKRLGNATTINELCDSVGVDAARYFFVQRALDSHLDFDIELAKRQSNDNPVYYAQYAHARMCSIQKLSLLHIYLPKVVLDRAKQLLNAYENRDDTKGYQPSLFVMDPVQPEKSELLQRLQQLDIDSMTPREALDCLYELKKLSNEID